MAAKELPGLPLTVTQEVVGFFPPKPAAVVDHSLSGGRMPVFICRTRHGIPPQHHEAALLPEDQGFYGLPQARLPPSLSHDLCGRSDKRWCERCLQVEVGGVKVAAHHVGPVLHEGPPNSSSQEGGGWPSEREAEQARSRHQQVGGGRKGCMDGTSQGGRRGEGALLTVVVVWCGGGAVYDVVPVRGLVPGVSPAAPPAAPAVRQPDLPLHQHARPGLHPRTAPRQAACR